MQRDLNDKTGNCQKLTTCLGHHPGESQCHVSAIYIYKGREGLSAGIIIAKHRPRSFIKWWFSETSRTPGIRAMIELKGKATRLAMRSR